MASDLPGDMQGVSITEDGECDSTEGMENNVDHTKKLPFELLLHLFSYFSRDSVVSCQRVCHRWRDAAQDSSLWKNYTIEVSGADEDERYIKIMPSLKNIKGISANSFINTILENVDDLEKINILFTPPLTSSQIKNVIKKFPRLESITIELCTDVVQSVQILKTSKFLKEIHFSGRACYMCSYPKSLKVFRIFSEKDSFPCLTVLNFPEFLLKIFFDKPALLKMFTDIIKNRSQQLLRLDLPLQKATNEALMKAVNLCTNLRELFICLYGKPSTNVGININKMTQLHRLMVVTEPRNTKTESEYKFQFLTKVHNFLCQGFLSNLSILILKISTHQKFKILGAVIENVKQLTTLAYWDAAETTDEKELMSIGSLLKLEVLTISGLKNISKDGIGYLSKCYNLNEFDLYARSNDSKNIEVHIANMLRQMKKVQKFTCGVFYAAGIIYIPIENKQDIELFVTKNQSQQS